MAAAIVAAVVAVVVARATDKVAADKTAAKADAAVPSPALSAAKAKAKKAATAVVVAAAVVADVAPAKMAPALPPRIANSSHPLNHQAPVSPRAPFCGGSIFTPPNLSTKPDRSRPNLTILVKLGFPRHNLGNQIHASTQAEPCPPPHRLPRSRRCPISLSKEAPPSPAP